MRLGDILGREGNEAEGRIGPVSKFLCFGTRLMMWQLLEIEYFKNSSLGVEEHQFILSILSLTGFYDL